MKSAAKSARAGAVLVTASAEALKWQFVEANTVRSLIDDKGFTFVDIRTLQAPSPALSSNLLPL